MSLNGKPICEIEDCGARVHGHGLCRVHYDQVRYAESTGGDPEAEAAAKRERWIETELHYGPGSVPEWVSPTGSMFATDEERREAWEARKDKLLDRLTQPPYCGLRPDAWWEFEAGRPQYLTAADSRDIAVGTRQEHEREVEKFTFLAAGGHLTESELEIIERKAAEARERIGTDREQLAALSPNYGGDKLKAALGDAVREARRAA